MNSSPSTPLRIPRLASLTLTFVLSTIAACVGLNSLIKSNQSQSKLISKVPPPTVVEIDISDVRRSGITATVVCLLAAILSLVYAILLLVPAYYGSTSTPLSTRTLRLQWMTLAFIAVFLFAVQVPFTLFFATRAAKIRAFVGNLELPHSVIQAVERQLGVSSVYKEIGYLRLSAVFPWLALASILVSVAITIAAISRARHPELVHNASMDEKRASDVDIKKDSAEQELQERV